VGAREALRRELWPAALRLSVRMVVHSGEAEAREGDYHGSAVNRAVRLRALADGDQILLSAATAGLVADALPRGAALANLGERLLPGIARPEPVFALEGPAPVTPPPAPGERSLPPPARRTGGPAATRGGRLP